MIDRIQEAADNNTANLATAMVSKDFDSEGIKLMTVVKKYARKIHAKAQPNAAELSLQIEVLRFTPSGIDINEEV